MIRDHVGYESLPQSERVELSLGLVSLSAIAALVRGSPDEYWLLYLVGGAHLTLSDADGDWLAARLRRGVTGRVSSQDNSSNDSTSAPPQ